MSNLVVTGGKKLSGEIAVGGSKNAALPIIFASIAISGVTRIDNIPDILDVEISFKILEHLGAKVRVEGNCAILDTRYMKYKTIPSELTASLRASTYLIGSCLLRFGKVELTDYGGCSFGNRPIDMHIYAAKTLGASLTDGVLVSSGLSGGVIKFDKVSVGATVNSLIMCSGASGESRIYGYAREPHVMSLIDFLRRAGARITVTENYISVVGGDLKGSYSEIIPDMIEAGTYLALSIATDSNLTVIGADEAELSSFVGFLSSCGVSFETGNGYIRAVGMPNKFAELVTGPYPEFPTDLHPVITPLLALSEGGSITEGVWPERFAYLTELSRFGLKYDRFSCGARIIPSTLFPAKAIATDLRGGAALLISALSVKGESIIGSAELIKRGYADLPSKLSRIGASIIEEK